MPIVQVPFEVPPEIYDGILAGKYNMFGGVVREAVGAHKGQIVKHLKPVGKDMADKAKNAGVRVAELVKENPKIALVGGLVIGVGAGAIAIGKKVSQRIKEKDQDAVKKFEKVFKIYLNAIKHGNLTLEIIEEVMDALTELNTSKRVEEYSIKMTASELEVLLNSINEYTFDLAKRNNVELSEVEKQRYDGTIIGIMPYLTAQKRIFETAA
ncbi:MAG: hypothetical protein K6F14_00930 [Clostridiales bacterium]|nr:hypothetical protein [Clostridiales bacterium]